MSSCQVRATRYTLACSEHFLFLGPPLKPQVLTTPLVLHLGEYRSESESESISERAIEALGRIYRGATKFAVDDDDDLYAHILLRLQRLCGIDEPRLADVAKQTLRLAFAYRQTSATCKVGCPPFGGLADNTIAGTQSRSDRDADRDRDCVQVGKRVRVRELSSDVQVPNHCVLRDVQNDSAVELE